uniref:Glycoprotein vIgFam14 n=1 Tax=Elephant endotheliotropic herpesvirus 1A TaxID=759753 RepID=A0A1L3HP57_ELHV1|nr:glycoprotein vIgFam14 [Elephant endotheliotropic herpesvirus 1A]AYF58433.1 glycoprotein vIgFam14 [Elephant endotheliotropic herpesvirus 1B]
MLLTGGGGFYISTIHIYTLATQFCILDCYIFSKIVNVGGNITFGPIPSSQYTKVEWFYNHDKLIIYWNITNTIYYETNAKLLEQFPSRLNISNVRIEDAGNYTVKLKESTETRKYEFTLIVNTVKANSTTSVTSYSTYKSNSGYLNSSCIYLLLTLVFLIN